MTIDFLKEFEFNQLISYFGKMAINTFTISNEDLSKSTGSGIYLSAAAIDHSCSPNCIIIFNGIELSIRSISKDIKRIDNQVCFITYVSIFYCINLKSLKARISYINLLSTKEERHNELEKQYYFKCQDEKEMVVIFTLKIKFLKIFI